jgi:hypothetical protein
MFAFGVTILWRSACGRPLSIKAGDWLGWTAASVVLIVAFCLGGRRITETDYSTAFSWPLFAVGLGMGLAVCIRALTRSQRER